MLKAGEFKSSPAMWNPTFETLFLLVGKLVTIQFWVKTLCFLQRKYKRALAFPAEAEAGLPFVGSSTLCFSPWPHIRKSSLWLALVERKDYGQDVIWLNRRVWCQHGAPLSSPAPITSSDLSYFFGFEFSHHFFRLGILKLQQHPHCLFKYNFSNIKTSIDCLFPTLFLYPFTTTSPTPKKNSWSKNQLNKTWPVVLSSTPTCSPENPFS